MKDTYNPDNRYKNHIFPELGNKDIAKITRTDILAIQNKMYTTRSKATTQQIISLISSIFKFAINSDNVLYTGKNPCEGLMQGRKLDNSRLRYLDKKEVAILLEAVKDNKELDLFVRLSLSTGGRLQSIINLKAKDIFNENISISISKTGRPIMDLSPNPFYLIKSF
jgi:integrase